MMWPFGGAAKERTFDGLAKMHGFCKDGTHGEITYDGKTGTYPLAAGNSAEFMIQTIQKDIDHAENMLKSENDLGQDTSQRAAKIDALKKFKDVVNANAIKINNERYGSEKVTHS